MNFKHIKPLRFTKALLLALVIVFGFAGDTAMVFASDKKFYAANDILFYDKDAACGTGNSTLSGNSNAEKIWNFLVSKGLTANQAAGVMGNIKAESNYNPGVEEHATGVGYGIAQWSFERRTMLEKAAKKKGVKVSDLAFQLEYLYQELTSRTTNRPEYNKYKNEWEMIKGQSSINDALVAFHHEFEISHLMNKPDPRAAVIAARGKGARDAYAKYSKNAPSAAGVGASCAVTGNLSEATLAYAWPKNEGSGYTKKKPEYEAAVKKAKSEGKYTGAGCYGGGVDCGAFVTLLLTNSGFEPSYNFKGKGGNTPIQVKWVEKNWEKLGGGGSIDTGNLKPGDVAMSPGHTFVYVGKIPGFDSKIASASQCDRAPMAGTESLTRGGVVWYRKK